MAPELPLEIWLHIASLLTFGDLRRAMHVHRLFYNIVLEERYRDLQLLTQDPIFFLSQIESLTSPAIALRVRSLTIWPYYTWKAISAPPLVPTVPQGAPALPRRRSALHILQKLGQSSKISRPLSYFVIPSPPVLSFYLPDAKESSVVDAAAHLRNVDNLTLSWRLTGGKLLERSPICPFTSTFLRCSAGHLRALTLDFNITTLEKAIPDPTTLTCLKVLNIKIHTGEVPSYYQQNILFPLAPFVRGLYLSLESLSIETYVDTTLSPFFSALALTQFPNLSSLSLAMPFDMLHMPRPSGFNTFLRSHPLLEELTLKYVVCCPSPDSGFSQDILDWYGQCYWGITFFSLRKLQLRLHKPFAFWDSFTHLEKLTPISLGLTQLIVNNELTYLQIASILRHLADFTLQTLSITAKVISPQLLVLLASKCPNLRRLVMNVGMICLSEGDDIRSNAAQFNTVISERTAKDDLWYEGWKLNDIEIWMWEYGVDLKPQYDLMRVIANIVPSITSFCGRGNME